MKIKMQDYWLELSKSVLKGKFVELNAYIKKEKIS